MSLSIENTHAMFSCKNFTDIAKQTLAEMWKFANKELFCDVILISAEDGKKIAAHRAVLSARNEYFHTMFCGQFKETNNKEVTISEISGDILESLINYFYTGKIEIDENNVQLLLPKASIMLIPEIVEACSSFLISLINPANCLSMAKYANLYNCQSLLESAVLHMNEHFINIVVTDAFLNLSKEEVKEYLSSHELNVDNEKVVFEALMRWINYNSETRRCALSELLPAIRFCHIEDRYILEYILNSERNEYLFALLDEIQKNLLHNAQTMPKRIGTKANKIVVICNKNIQIYNSLKNVVQFKYSVPLCDNFSAAIVEEKIILIGENRVQCFDLIENEWHDLASTSTAAVGSGVAILNKCVYSTGGLKNGQIVNTVERWDANLNQWKKVASMNYSRHRHCTATLNGKLYVIGGRTGGVSLNSVECYDPNTNKWNVCSPLLTKRDSARAIVANNAIFVFGGILSLIRLDCIEKYNPVTNTWTKIAEMTCRRREMGAYLFNNKIYLLGGCYENKQSMEEFDPITNECKIVDAPNIEHEGSSLYCFPYLPKNS